MLSDDLCVDRSRVQPELAPEYLPQPGSVEHGARSDHPLGWKAGLALEDPCQDVDRIGDEHDDALITPEVLPQLADDRGVVAQELKAGLVGAATPSGGDDQGARVEHLV